MISKKFLDSLIKKNFNEKNIVSLIAYGSSAIPQKGNRGKMLDLLIISNNVEKFHEENLYLNKYHYNLLSRILGLQFITKINKLSLNVYFNHSVNLIYEDNSKIFVKYGVVELSTLKKDLLLYENLFILGRLHKPVIKTDSKEVTCNKEVEDFNLLIEINKKTALTIAMILYLKNHDIVEKIYKKEISNDDFLKQLFINLVNLSYLGDIRFKMKGEKKSKVEDIVNGGFENLKNYYLPQIESEIEFLNKLSNNSTNKDVYSIYIKNLIKNLPDGFITRLKLINKIYMTNNDFKIYLSNINPDNRLKIITSYLQKQNLKVSFNALIIGIITSPVLKGFVYIFRKISKALT
jgi:translocator assembly and maintenance protein 41